MTSSAPRETARMAVVGAGHWGPHLIRNFYEGTRSWVTSVIELDSERRAAIEGRYPGITVSDDLSLVCRDDVDAVIIASPTHTHFEIAAMALASGKHVFVEKPLAASAKEATELCEMADDRGLILMVGHVFLFNPGIRALRNAIVSGDLGEVRLVTMQRTNLGPIRRDVNAAWDLASHDVSIADYLLDSGGLAVNAVGGSWLQADTEDAVFMSIEYEPDTIVHIQASWLHPRKTRLVTVVGSERMATFDDMDLNEPLRIYDKTVHTSSVASEVADTFGGFRASILEGEVRIPRVRLGEPLRAECDEFTSRVIGESSDTLSDGRFGARVVKTLEAADRSISRSGVRIEVPT